MKTEKIVWGLTLVFVGTILLLDNFGIIDFYWSSIVHFWPLILILVGLNLVFGRRKNTPAATASMIIITCLVLAFVAYVGSSRSELAYRWNWSQNNDEQIDIDSSATNVFSEDYNPATKNAELHVAGGATTYEIKGQTDKLFYAQVQQYFGRYTLSKISRDSVEVLNFKMQGKKSNWDMDDANKVMMHLNTNPIWSIFLEMGAGQANFDLSDYKIAQLQIEGGAAGFDVKLGQPVSQTKVNVETGVAKVKLAVPENVACQISVKSGLSNKDFYGFEKQADGTYTSPNFNSSAKKIIIYLEGGLSDFEVNRY